MLEISHGATKDHYRICLFVFIFLFAFAFAFAFVFAFAFAFIFVFVFAFVFVAFFIFTDLKRWLGEWVVPDSVLSRSLPRK